MDFEKINFRYRVAVGASPKEADLAIVSIDSNGNLGQMNKYVLNEYGHSPDLLPKADSLNSGFSSISGIHGKPVLFVVTIDGKNSTVEALEENLYNALSEYRGWFRNKTVWIPLMGTGTGGLSLEDSYRITIKTINRFQKSYPTEVFFIISLPSSAIGRKFYASLIDTSDQVGSPASEFVSKLNINYFLVSSYSKELDPFYKEGLWQINTENRTDIDVVRRIRKNDIIFLRTESPGQKNMTIEKIGIVNREEDEGAAFGVDWRITGISIAIDLLQRIRHPFTALDLADVIEIFNVLDPDYWERLLPAKVITPPTSNKIAGLLSDSEKGTDYLDIKKDVVAFARVIAASSFEPPLAIALFGKWGSGKSFFMQKLKEKIIDFSNNNSKGIYCEGVVHIHFNAWSYMDANLWASFVSKIFEGLNEYITKNSSTDDIRKDIKSALNSSLTTYNEEIKSLEGKKEALKKEVLLLKKRYLSVKQEIKNKIKQIERQTVWHFIKKVDTEFKAKEKIIEALRRNNTYIQTEAKLQEIIPEKYWDNPAEAYNQVRSKYTFLQEFFVPNRYKSNLLWIVLIIGVIIIIPIVLEAISGKLSSFNFIIPQATLSLLILLGAAWKRAEAIYNKLQPVIATFWKVKEDYEKEKNEAVSRFEQEEKALKFEIEKGKEELLYIADQLQKAKIEKQELEFRISNALETEALYSFIEKRSKSEDYKKHLGIISIIRKDFEILNDLFIGHHREIEKFRVAEKFRSKFDRPLQRIILYVDDLDRCPEENVVEVLEAVNLLMAFPLFVVVVGVDPRWVKNALIKKYSLQFTGKLNSSYDVEIGVERIEPSNYLEKIFQVPFSFKRCLTSKCKGHDQATGGIYSTN